MNQNLYSNKIRKHRRLKFGVLAVLLTVVVIALIIVINVVFSSLARRFSLYADMTKEQIYGITEQSFDLLDSYRGRKDFSISIVFCQEADRLDDAYETRLVHELARKYEEEFDFVNVEYIDIINHPNAADQYLATSVSRPKTTSVYIVKNDLSNPIEKKQSRIYTIESFYTFDKDSGSVFAFNGEYRITAGILQLMGDSPIAYFVTGHGEEVPSTAPDAAKPAMWTLFEDAGYDVRTIDLSKEDIDDAAKVVVINCPKYDYMGSGDTVNEIRKIDNFLDRFGGLMVFMDPTAGEMPELDAFLSEWGIAFDRSIVRDLGNSLDVNGLEMVGTYTTEGAGASLTKTLRELNSVPKAIFNNPMPIRYTYDRGTDGQYSATFGSSVRYVSTVIQTGVDGDGKPTAEATPAGDLGNEEAVWTKGLYNLMTVTVDSRYIENEEHFSYVLAAGTSSFADDKYLGGRNYANRDIIFNAMKSFGRKTVPLDLEFKVFDDEALSITSAEAKRLTVVVTVLPAVAVGVAGIVVYVRRRYL